MGRHGLFRFKMAYLLPKAIKHGVENGQWRDFHENGQIAAEGDFLNGVEKGRKNWIRTAC